MKTPKGIGIAIDKAPALTETFIQAQLDAFPENPLSWIVRPDHLGKLGRPNELPLRSRLAGCIRRALNLGLSAAAGRQLGEALAANGIGVLLCHYGPTACDCLPAARQAGIPLVAHFHGYDVSRKDILRQYGARYGGLFAEAAALITVSRSMRNSLRELGAPEERIHLIPYGTPIREPLVPSANPPHLVFVGRLVPKKDPLGLIEVFRLVRERCPDSTMTLVGDGPLRSACENRIHRFGLAKSVTLTGFLDPARASSILATARIYVQPSRVASDGNSEGLPLAILEAMAAGLPVVSTRHAGIPDAVVHGDSGYLVPEGDYSAMARHLIDLIENPSLGDLLGKRGHLACKEGFAHPRQAHRLHQLLTDIS